jgi:hypothetical protein
MNKERLPKSPKLPKVKIEKQNLNPQWAQCTQRGIGKIDFGFCFSDYGDDARLRRSPDLPSCP